MASLIQRGNTWFVKFKDTDGKWKRKATGTVNEKEARKVLTEIERKLAAARSEDAPPVVAQTVRSYADTWIEERRKLDLDWQNDDSRLRNHVLPVIGDLELRAVRTRHIVALFKAIRTEGELAQRTIYNIYSVVSALFRDAKLEDRIEQTPCVLTERQLGPLTDKDPEWRASAVFSKEEVERIITASEIPLDRRVVYALEFLAGVRHGEAAGLRWRHYEPDEKPLGRLQVAVSYSSSKHRVKDTKTHSTRNHPVHPVLAAILAEWKLGGWAEMVGRPPGPDDLIVPLPPEVAARRRSRKGEPFRNKDWSGKRWREDDLPALDLRHRRNHDSRATFITLCEDDGADPTIIERITHTKKKRSAYAGYSRPQWERLCREVAKLDIRRNRCEKEVVEAVATAENPVDGPTLVVHPGSIEPQAIETKLESGWRRRESKPENRAQSFRNVRQAGRIRRAARTLLHPRGSPL